ncbi:MAG: LysM peptidoglycan-binding domain-containing protein [Planctomycetota bacterium]
MGSFEKLVVLTVVFLSAVVFAVSFDSSPGDPTKGGGAEVADLEPGRKPATEERSTPGSNGSAAPAPTVGTDGSAPNGAAPKKDNPFGGAGNGAGLLSSTGRATEADGASELGASNDDEAASLTGLLPVLRDGVEGLTSFPGHPGLQVFVVRPADTTWTGLSAYLYGDSSYARLLREENAAVGAPRPGAQILVPSRVDAEPRTAPFEARAPGRPAPAAPKGAQAAPVEELAGGELTGETYRTHVVVAGDTLSAIAFHYYGRGSLSTRIFDANRDQLKSPDDLQLGMKLRIP